MKTTWFSKNLGDAMLADIYMAELTESFELASVNANSPVDMTLFTRHESEGRLHCELVAYFSPACERIAKQLGATPCRIPLPNDLSLKSGTEESWNLLFPDFKRNH